MVDDVLGVTLGSGGIGGRAKDLTRRLKYGDRVTRTRRTRVDTEVSAPAPVWRTTRQAI